MELTRRQFLKLLPFGALGMAAGAQQILAPVRPEKLAVSFDKIRKGVTPVILHREHPVKVVKISKFGGAEFQLLDAFEQPITLNSAVKTPIRISYPQGLRTESLIEVEFIEVA